MPFKQSVMRLWTPPLLGNWCFLESVLGTLWPHTNAEDLVVSCTSDGDFVVCYTSNGDPMICITTGDPVAICISAEDF